MGKTWRDEAHRVSKHLYRKWIDAFRSHSPEQKKIRQELIEADIKSGGVKKKWYRTKGKQELIDKKHIDLPDE